MAIFNHHVCMHFAIEHNSNAFFIIIHHTYMLLCVLSIRVWDQMHRVAKPSFRFPFALDTRGFIIFTHTHSHTETRVRQSITGSEFGTPINVSKSPCRVAWCKLCRCWNDECDHRCCANQCLNVLTDLCSMAYKSTRRSAWLKSKRAFDEPEQ